MFRFIGLCVVSAVALVGFSFGEETKPKEVVAKPGKVTEIKKEAVARVEFPGASTGTKVTIGKVEGEAEVKVTNQDTKVGGKTVIGGDHQIVRIKPKKEGKIKVTIKVEDTSGKVEEVTVEIEAK